MSLQQIKWQAADLVSYYKGAFPNDWKEMSERHAVAQEEVFAAEIRKAVKRRS